MKFRWIMIALTLTLISCSSPKVQKSTGMEEPGVSDGADSASEFTGAPTPSKASKKKAIRDDKYQYEK